VHGEKAGGLAGEVGGRIIAKKVPKKVGDFASYMGGTIGEVVGRVAGEALEEGYDKIDVLKKLLSYVKNYKDKESSYTIQWKSVEGDTLHTSYFSAKNVQSALDKLFYDRDPNSLTIFSVMLNPTT
jgi:hypothetical protein